MGTDIHMYAEKRENGAWKSCYPLNRQKEAWADVPYFSYDMEHPFITMATNQFTSIMSVPASKRLYQFNITLTDSDPPIWRRVQLKNCTLERLHEVIVLAMGWPHSQFSALIYEFRINERRFGWTATTWYESTNTEISELMPEDSSPFTFTYECSLDNRWCHEVSFEGVRSAEPGKRYPLCLDGERACPPDLHVNYGSMAGYKEFLKVLANPELLQEPQYKWLGADFDLVEDFDPNYFDAEQATKAMRRRLPDSRQARPGK